MKVKGEGAIIQKTKKNQQAVREESEREIKESAGTASARTRGTIITIDILGGASTFPLPPSVAPDRFIEYYRRNLFRGQSGAIDVWEHRGGVNAEDENCIGGGCGCGGV